MISPQNESYRLLQRDNILEVFTAAQYLGIKGKTGKKIIYRFHKFQNYLDYYAIIMIIISY